MSDREVNTISHLLEVEQKASLLTSHAQEDADKKIAAAKVQADAEFQAQFKKIVETCEKSYSDKVAALEESKNQKISEYKTRISAFAQDKSAFNSYLDSILLA